MPLGFGWLISENVEVVEVACIREFDCIHHKEDQSHEENAVLKRKKEPQLSEDKHYARVGNNDLLENLKQVVDEEYNWRRTHISVEGLVQLDELNAKVNSNELP